jgi:NADH:ubiquinone oxidoreductase subunit 6 (subunit J)
VLYAILVTGAGLCAFLAIRARQLIESALWLAGTSVLVSIALYALGAQTAAVIELSVGAGLVTVLFVFAISIAGDDALKERVFIRNRVAITLAVGFAVLLGWMVLPVDTASSIADETSFAVIVWDNRALDVLLQLVLIFTGVLCLLGLLMDERPAHARHTEVPITTVISGGNGHSESGITAAASPATEEARELEKEEAVL